MESRPYNRHSPGGNRLAGLSVLSGLRFAHSHPNSKERQKRAGQIKIKAGTGISQGKDTGRRLKRLLIDLIPMAMVRWNDLVFKWSFFILYAPPITCQRYRSSRMALSELIDFNQNERLKPECCIPGVLYRDWKWMAPSTGIT